MIELFRKIVKVTVNYFCTALLDYYFEFSEVDESEIVTNTLPTEQEDNLSFTSCHQKLVVKETLRCQGDSANS